MIDMKNDAVTQLERQVDVLIIGGGVGGLTLAQWLTGLGRSWCLLERESHLGGPLATSEYVLKWIPGQAQISGRDYLAAMVAQIDPANCELQTQLSAVKVGTDLSLGDFACTLSNGDSLRAKKLVFACGATPFSPFTESERVIVGPGLQKIAHIAAGQRVAVLGGGDNAADHALILAEMGAVVTMLVRGQLRVSAALMQQLRQNAAIVIRTGCQNIELNANAESVLVQGERYDYAAVYFGYQVSQQLNAFPELKTAAGALQAGVFAIGDMTEPVFPNILLTQGQAAVVAKQIDFELSRDAS
ncbi:MULTISPECIES: NAD(P)/FAD-dependent oxidoreductase [Deefgea]|nr:MULTISPECIES: FAD-dependent oxidoreductase [Deefgea]MBM9889146.1 NAD(P)/FAD-dependent oxidoreductase [Deefgea sp. CFH1-16]